jgi:hypothetical protein
LAVHGPQLNGTGNRQMLAATLTPAFPVRIDRMEFGRRKNSVAGCLSKDHRARGFLFTYATALWLLACLFSLRVAGQAIQGWAPQPFLPHFDSFQGSGLPYWLLLPAQIVILGVMVLTCWRISVGLSAPNPRLGRALFYAGAVYMVGSLGRIAVGWAVPEAAPWFRTWIPAFFHVVLASYVLAVAGYHLRANRRASV